MIEQIASLIRAIASLAWPTLGLVIAYLFRKEIRSLAGRLKKGKFLGQELELAELQKLEEGAAAALKQLPPPMETGLAKQRPDSEDVRDRVLGEARASPKLALISLQGEIEKETRELLASLGTLGTRKGYPLPEMLRTLRNQGNVPTALIRSAESFLSVRNKIVHGRSASDDDVLSAIDSGLTILTAIRSVPHETNVVAHPSVEGYSDSAGTQVCAGFKVLLLDTRSPGGASVQRRAFPTTKLHFKTGQRVSWEWDSTKTFGETWYRDPDSSKVTYGWTESMEFVGRPFEHL
jgi:hypothetical protein